MGRGQDHLSDVFVRTEYQRAPAHTTRHRVHGEARLP
jgi:hypothetical protein